MCNIGSETHFDIQRVLDDGPWPALQVMVVVLAALSIVLDGFDSQLIGFAIPVLMKEWGLARGDFAPVVAAGLVGMGIGSAIAGAIGDKLGRRMAMIGSVVTFGVATALIGLAPNLTGVAVLRFIAGLGIGGALPSAAIMAGEFTPRRLRTMAITATIVCVPLGGMVAGFFAGWIIPTLGWRVLFAVGGLMPLALAAILFAALPESPRWLASRPARRVQLITLLRRIGRDLPDEATFYDSAETGAPRAGLGALFHGREAVTTLLLWAAFFLCLLAVYSAFSWLPTMLTGEGLSVASAGQGLTAYNLGGVLGALACAVAISRLGSRWPLVVCCLGGGASAFFLTRVDIVGDFQTALLGITLHGLFVNAVQSTLYAVAAQIYPTSVRATGVASALAFGRLGAILSAFVGAAVITAGGAHGYLIALTLAMLGAGGALLVLPRHISSASK